jgi:hypothetical protein
MTNGTTPSAELGPGTLRFRVDNAASTACVFIILEVMTVHQHHPSLASSAIDRESSTLPRGQFGAEPLNGSPELLAPGRILVVPR